MASFGSNASRDPELNKLEDNTNPVALNDTLTVSLEYLDKNPLQLQWSQQFKTNSDTYYQVAFTNTSKGDAKYYLFISSGKLDDFRKLDTAQGAGDRITFKVTKDFQYGQRDGAGKNRFLVYHESDRNVVKQARFVQASWLKYGNLASGFIDGLNTNTRPDEVFDIMSKFHSNPLKKFQG